MIGPVSALPVGGVTLAFQSKTVKSNIVQRSESAIAIRRLVAGRAIALRHPAANDWPTCHACYSLRVINHEFWRHASA